MSSLPELSLSSLHNTSNSISLLYDIRAFRDKRRIIMVQPGGTKKRRRNKTGAVTTLNGKGYKDNKEGRKEKRESRREKSFYIYLPRRRDTFIRWMMIFVFGGVCPRICIISLRKLSARDTHTQDRSENKSTVHMHFDPFSGSLIKSHPSLFPLLATTYVDQEKRCFLRSK